MPRCSTTVLRHRILLKNFKDPSDAEVRKDFPGGWAGDPVNKFVSSGRTEAENEAFNFTKKLATYRKNCSALHDGKLTQFLPKDGIYVFFRQDDSKTVMVIMSQSEAEQSLSRARFDECMHGFIKAKTW
ncbi:MAG: cyclomaltodextrinase C-terminal domain-containing protein [Saprospiraceae bacterium]